MKGFLLLFRDRVVMADFLHCDKNECVVAFQDKCDVLIHEEMMALKRALRPCERDVRFDEDDPCTPEAQKELDRARKAVEDKRKQYDCVSGRRVFRVPRDAPEYYYCVKRRDQLVNPKY
jgi:hypothetical protein